MCCQRQKGIIIDAQNQTFFGEYERLAKGNTSNANKILALKPQLDEDGLLHSHCRLQNVNYPSYGVRYPIILPRGHIVTKLIIKHHHEDNHHAIGTNQLLAKLSVRFCRVSAQEVERNCNECKKRKAKLAKQIIAPLPALRYKEPLRAFTKIVLDVAGHFITKQRRRKKCTKIYLGLFMCLLYRAVHLEIAYGMDTSSFLDAFYRVVNRSRLPLEVVSDKEPILLKEISS